VRADRGKIGQSKPVMNSHSHEKFDDVHGSWIVKAANWTAVSAEVAGFDFHASAIMTFVEAEFPSACNRCHVEGSPRASFRFSVATTPP